MKESEITELDRLFTPRKVSWLKKRYRGLVQFIRWLPWEFNWRFVKRHQYHVIRPRTLKPGYHDPDDRMLHACMETLVEHCEMLKATNPTEIWSDDGEGEFFDAGMRRWNAARREMKVIYDWWTVERLAEAKALDDNFTGEAEEVMNDKEQEMLHRLVDIRFYLWD